MTTYRFDDVDEVNIVRSENKTVLLIEVKLKNGLSHVFSHCTVGRAECSYLCARLVGE